MLAHKIKILRLDTTHSCHPLHRQEIILDEDKLVRRRNRLTITRISPSTFCDHGGMSLNIQTNKVLLPSAKITISFKARNNEEMRVQPIQPEIWEVSLCNVITVLPNLNMETSLVQ